MPLASDLLTRIEHGNSCRGHRIDGVEGIRLSPISVRSRIIDKASTPSSAFVVVAVVFAGNGFQAGAYTVLLADLVGGLDLTRGALGLALAGLSAAAMVGSLSGGWLADRVATRATFWIGHAGAVVFFTALAAADSYPQLLAAMIGGGVLLGMFDLIPETLAGDYEREHAKRRMTRFHIVKNGAAAGGSLAAGIGLWLGLDYRTLYIIVAAMLLLVALFAGFARLPRHGASQGQRPGATPLSLAFVTSGVAIAAVLVGLVSLTDAALEGYSSLMLRDVLQSGPLLAGMGVAGFQLARLVGQWTSLPIAAKYGDGPTLAACGIGLTAGLVLLIGSTYPPLGILGLLVIGGFAAPILPIAFSLGARSSASRPGQATSLVWCAFYLAFLVGPVAIGFLADWTGMRAAFALLILASLAIALIGRRV